MRELAWLIPVLPYFSFFLIVFFGKRLPRKGHEIGIAAIALSFILSVGTFFQTIAVGEPLERSVEWLRFGGGSRVLELGMHVDGLTAVMFLVVTFVSLMVQVYSTEYMRGDRRYTWYYAALSL